MNQATRTGLAASVLAVFLSSCAVGASAPTASPPTRAPTSTPTFRPTATSTSAPTIAPLPTPTLNPSLGTLLLGYRDCYDLGCAVHTARTDLPRSLFGRSISFHSVPAMEGPYLLQDVSPDYKSLLLSAGSNLYVSDLWGNDPDLITTNFVDSLEEITAFWMRSGSIAYIGYADAQRYIYLVSSDGSDLRRITDVGMKPGWLAPGGNERGILWGAGWVEGGRTFVDGLRWTNVDGSETVRFPDDQYHGSLSPTSATVAYVAERREDELVGGVWYPTRSQAVVLFDLDSLTARDIELPFFSLGSYLVESVAWLPDGQHLLLQLLRAQGGRLPVVIDLQGGISAVFQEGWVGTPVIFSPDASHFILFSGLPTIYSMDTGAGQSFNPQLPDGHLQRLVWLPPGS